MLPRMNTADLTDIDGKIVLVTSARDHRNPPTGMRGTIRVRDTGVGDRHVVQIELEFPQMFLTRAHHRTLTLTDAEIDQLVTANYDGTFSLQLDDRLDPEAPPGNE